jgi:nitrogen fixation protein FixH
MSTEGWFANGFSGRHMLLSLVIFFGVMLIANGMLVYYALDTFSGGDRPDPYRAGLDYNDRIAAAKKQDALGWTTDLAYDDAKGRLAVTFHDKTKAPVSGLKLEGVVGRGATNREDQTVAFKEISQGVYTSDVRLAPGQWVVALQSRKVEGGDPVYRLKRRLYVADRP